MATWIGVNETHLVLEAPPMKAHLSPMNPETPFIFEEPKRTYFKLDLGTPFAGTNGSSTVDPHQKSSCGPPAAFQDSGDGGFPFGSATLSGHNEHDKGFQIFIHHYLLRWSYYSRF
jgi:hypothetical protein